MMLWFLSSFILNQPQCLLLVRSQFFPLPSLYSMPILIHFFSSQTLVCMCPVFFLMFWQVFEREPRWTRGMWHNDSLEKHALNIVDYCRIQQLCNWREMLNEDLPLRCFILFVLKVLFEKLGTFYLKVSQCPIQHIQDFYLLIVS
jgi:hypothetical protein